MKIITLAEPGATAIAVGLKRFETRKWSTNYRGPLAIHASKLWTDEQAQQWEALAALWPDRLPAKPNQGRIVATCELADVYATEHVSVGGTEAMLGDFSAGLYAWQLLNVRAVPKPIKFRGQQGISELDPHVVAKLVRGDVAAARYGSGGVYV